jgi:hypothetical protein
MPSNSQHEWEAKRSKETNTAVPEPKGSTLLRARAQRRNRQTQRNGNFTDFKNAATMDLTGSR